jgi:transcriptional regulator with XRE-family HTH domain
MMNGSTSKIHSENPPNSLPKGAKSRIKRFSKELGTSEVVEVMEPVIDALATFFGVSRLAAKIRMIDVGYEEAIGAFTYIDGRYIKPHTFKKGFLQRNQTFSISAEDAAIQSITNPNLMVVLEEYNFLFVDSHFVVDHPKYVTRDLFGRTALTNYARKHMDECCLVFDLSLRTGVRERYHRECFLNRDEGALISFDIVYSKGYQFAPPEKQIELLKKVVMEEAAIYNELPNNLSGSLKRLKDWRGVTFSELADRALINERTVRRIVNGEEPGSLNSIILICLALHLPPKISRHVIAQSQFSLSYSNENHIWYQFVLDHKYANTLDEIRTFLAERGAEPL